MARSLVAGALALVLGAGCLSDVHKVPRDELIRLAQTPPADRGKSVRVVQQFSGGESPPNAPVSFQAGVWVSAPVPTVVRGPGAASMAKAESDVWRALAAIAAVGLVFTEGMRYDGWVGLNPGHPVHLYFPDGQYTWRRLDQLDPQTAMAADRAYVRETEGPFLRLGRAPLDREGFTFTMLMGMTDIPRSSLDAASAFSTHVQFGYFPVSACGLHLDLAFASGNVDGYTVFDSRSSVEVQLFPLQLGVLHSGPFTSVGLATRLDDGPGRDGSSGTWGAGSSGTWGVGWIVQLELTTRLALTARAGLHSVHGERAKDLLLGLSIY